MLTLETCLVAVVDNSYKCLSVCLPVCLPACLPACLSTCLSVCLTTPDNPHTPTAHYTCNVLKALSSQNELNLNKCTPSASRQFSKFSCHNRWHSHRYLGFIFIMPGVFTHFSLLNLQTSIKSRDLCLSHQFWWSCVSQSLLHLVDGKYSPTSRRIIMSSSAGWISPRAVLGDRGCRLYDSEDGGTRITRDVDI